MPLASVAGVEARIVIGQPTFLVFLAVAFTLAVLPGPGMFYVLAPTLWGGRLEGVLSTVGTGGAGLVHTVAAHLNRLLTRRCGIVSATPCP